jgi:hypothetical protein
MEQFELQSFLIGLAAGLALMALLRLRALKTLALKLNQIGVELGVEGFEPERQHRGIQVGDVSGQVGDIATGNIDKSVSNFHRNLKKVFQGASQPLLRVKRTDSVRVESRDTAFAERLKEIQQARAEDWFDTCVTECLARSELRRPLDEAIKDWERRGWTIETLSFDNHGAGLHVNAELSRPYRDGV